MLPFQVRMAACVALVAFVQSAGSSYCSTNSGYLAAGVAIHMDDGDAQVAEAACQVSGAIVDTTWCQMCRVMFELNLCPDGGHISPCCCSLGQWH